MVVGTDYRLYAMVEDGDIVYLDLDTSYYARVRYFQCAGEPNIRHIIVCECMYSIVEVPLLLKQLLSDANILRTMSPDDMKSVDDAIERTQKSECVHCQ